MGLRDKTIDKTLSKGPFRRDKKEKNPEPKGFTVSYFGQKRIRNKKIR